MPRGLLLTTSSGIHSKSQCQRHILFDFFFFFFFAGFSQSAGGFSDEGQLRDGSWAEIAANAMGINLMSWECTWTARAALIYLDDGDVTKGGDSNVIHVMARL